MKLKCHKCGHEWDYKGKRRRYASCPDCKANVNIQQNAQQPYQPQPITQQPPVQQLPPQQYPPQNYYYPPPQQTPPQQYPPQNYYYPPPQQTPPQQYPPQNYYYPPPQQTPQRQYQPFPQPELSKDLLAEDIIEKRKYKKGYYCKHCLSDIPDDALECPSCGEIMFFCLKCYAQIDEDEEMCSICLSKEPSPYEKALVSYIKRFQCPYCSFFLGDKFKGSKCPWCGLQI